jgi:hypothetical protein
MNEMTRDKCNAYARMNDQCLVGVTDEEGVRQPVSASLENLSNRVASRGRMWGELNPANSPTVACEIRSSAEVPRARSVCRHKNVSSCFSKH